MKRILPALATLAIALTAATPAPAQQSIIGGHAAAHGSWPSIVALIDHGQPDNWAGQFCGGTLVTTSWVLTAAHCVEGATAAQVDVLGGTERLDGSGTRVAVAQIHVHPSWNDSTNFGDLALLELATPLTLPTMAVPSPALSGLWAAGRTAHVAGWGNTSTSGTSYPTDLREVDVPLVADSTCGGIYGGYSGAVMLCAGDLANGGVDTCQGDSGGPLVVEDAAGGKVLTGDTSYGYNCAEAGYPGVYGEIAGMRAFVDATIGWSSAASPDAGSVSFTGATAGVPTAPKAVTLTSTGTAPLSIAATRLAGGAGASAFAIAADGCSQVVLSPGESCSVSVRATAGADGDRFATLAFDGDGAAGTTSVALAVSTSGVADGGGGGAGGGGGGGGATTATTTPTTTATTTATTTTAPTATTTTTGTTPPRPKAAVAPAATLRALAPRHGAHRLAARLDGPGSITITLTRKVKRDGKRVTEKLGTATATFAAAGTRTLKVRLTAAGRRALRRGARPRATATVVTRSGAAEATVTRTLTLR